MSSFEPTAQAARARLIEINPNNYAKTRNNLDGVVTYLSPYISHGILTIPEAIAHLMGKYRLNFDDKLVFEFAWREFFHHVWLHLDDKIFSDIRPACWQGHYASSMPEDVLTATTGIAAIDQAVTQLYASGYLHNHARMWLASYLIHLRKIHWRVAADWMYRYLLDGDLASNHLSWQWVGATFSAKPYLFNAENVAKYAPAAWHSAGTVIDQDYSALEAIARTQGAVALEPLERRQLLAPQMAPEVFSAPPAALLEHDSFKSWPVVGARDLPKRGLVQIVHPWCMGEYLTRDGSKQRMGLIHLPFHAQHPWTYERWKFVLTRMRQVTDMVFIGDASELGATLKSAHTVSTQNPGYRQVFDAMAKNNDFQRLDEPAQFGSQPELCPSFTQFYQKVRADSVKLMAIVDNRF
jgi:deoxyribodipyrimidine photo-lyase